MASKESRPLIVKVHSGFTPRCCAENRHGHFSVTRNCYKKGRGTFKKKPGDFSSGFVSKAAFGGFAIWF